MTIRTRSLLAGAAGVAAALLLAVPAGDELDVVGTRVL